MSEEATLLTEQSLELLGREKEHYKALEDLYSFCNGNLINQSDLCKRLRETISDWDRMMMGSSGSLLNTVNPFIGGIKISDMEITRKLYFFLSPIFFFIHSLLEVSRNAFRNSVTASGIFCERIVRNILQEIDRQYSLQVYKEVKDAKFDKQNGRLKKELEERGFELADDLFSLLKSIYFMRSRMGPHDVPPPEKIQAKITVNHCLPAYIDYLDALVFLGNELGKEYETFISFFNNLTQTRIALVFGAEIERMTPTDFIKEVLYREGFFKEGRIFQEIMEAMERRRYTFGKPSVANALRELSMGKDAILTRRHQGGQYRYFERIPPDKYFKSTI